MVPVNTLDSASLFRNTLCIQITCQLDIHGTQGRKKKPFIDKKHSQTYRLVPRSQQDPLSENVDEAQYVLKALQVNTVQFAAYQTKISTSTYCIPSLVGPLSWIIYSRNAKVHGLIDKNLSIVSIVLRTTYCHQTVLQLFPYPFICTISLP